MHCAHLVTHVKGIVLDTGDMSLAQYGPDANRTAGLYLQAELPSVRVF